MMPNISIPEDATSFLTEYQKVADDLGDEYRHFTTTRLLHIQLCIAETLAARQQNGVL